MKARLILILLAIPVSFSAFAPVGGRVPVYEKNGMVVSSSVIASEVGRDILKSGGNAIDAAVATAFALAVTWPTAGNIGGGGFMVSVDKTGKATTIDFREKAPLAANANMYLDANGKLIRDLNRIGVLSSGTPGTVAGLYLAHSKYGKLPWKKLVDPAVRLASKGFPFTYSLYDQSNNQKEAWSKFPSTMKVMSKNGTDIYQQGEIWKQPDLAATLKRIRDHGKDGFYKGETAAKLVAFMKAQGGIITQQDLDHYEAIERRPVVGTYRDYTVYSMPPPSSGGVALIEMLNILEGYDLPSLGYRSADHIHILREAMVRAFASRAEYMGDPEFNPDIPLEKLTSKEYARKLRGGIKMDIASPSDSSRFGQIYEGGQNTTHLSVADHEGNAVSLTYTIEQGYGSKVVADGLGFFLNDQMGDFNPMPGVTNRAGQIGTSPNLIAPGKRMLSSMSPTIVTKDGRPVIVIGAQGGRTIINTVLQIITNTIDFKMNIAQAVEAPRMHHQWLPDLIIYENQTIPLETSAKLKSKGHVLMELPMGRGLGDAMGIYFDAKTGYFMGAADSRSSDGGARGY